jgi:two-component system chemotaxis response regulator CheY
MNSPGDRTDGDPAPGDRIMSDSSPVAPSVLVVESVRSTRELMALVLQRHYRTQTAATYEQALRRARTTSFDAVLMSVTLRGVEAGSAMIEDVRALDGYAEVPIMVVVGPSLDAGKERLAAAGGDGFLRMPFVRSDLLEILHRHLHVSENETEED